MSGLSQQIKQAITDGRLASGVRLPSTRALCRSLSISRNSALAVYDALASEGYIESRPGGGTFVRPMPVSLRTERSRGEHQNRLTSYWQAQKDQAVLPVQPPRFFDFRVGMPEIKHFPFRQWRRGLTQAARLQANNLTFDASPQGTAELRQAIAQHLSVSRGLPCNEQELVVTSGAQQALDLIGRILIEPGKSKVAMDSPGYPMARCAFEAAGALVVPVEVDSDGMKVEQIPHDVSLVYVTPSHQFPFGMSMSVARRLALLQIAEQHGMSIIEDDYDSEFRIAGMPLESMKLHDKQDNVFYIGTFSKCLLPDLRCGFVQVPDWARGALTKAKFQADWHCNSLQQFALADFIKSGALEKYLRKMRRIYKKRYQALFAACGNLAPDMLKPIPINTGVHMSAHLTAKVNASTLRHTLLAHDVSLSAWQDFSQDKQSPNGLIFGFGRIDCEEIEAGVEIVAEQIRRLVD